VPCGHLHNRQFRANRRQVESNRRDAAGIHRVKGAKRLGVRVGNWLTAEQYLGCKQRLRNAVNDNMGLEL